MRDHPDTILIFAAGLGTRMGALTRDRPKPLIEVAGRSLLDHALALADAVPLRRIVVNAHYLPEQIVAHLAPRPDIAVSLETPTLLDTGGGLRHAAPLLGSDTVYTLNSDAVWTGSNPLKLLAGHWDPDRMEALMLMLPRASATGYVGRGDFIMNDEGRLTRGPGAVYSGAQIIRTDLLNQIEEHSFSVNRLWSRMEERGTLYGVMHPGGWCDVGRPEGIALAQSLLAEQADV
ncbi:nucleotidyltransferase family protein [Brevirhabdus sp.]|uniref:nucleotidyltransferase family protein n=1 Tax=Brevirhabdus sp. TaxID=2004514 RepID=UPI00405A17E5